MDFNLSDEQSMLQQGAQRYAREHLGVPARRLAAGAPAGFSRDTWSAFADMGWLSLLIPEDAGGLGGSDVDVALLTEELGKALSIAPFVDTAVLGVTLIGASKGPLREKLLAGIAAGQYRTALAHNESGRSDYETPVSAKADPDGAAGWRISGIKPRVVHGPSATHWMVSALPAGRTSPAIFVVEAEAAASSVGAYPLIDGSYACDLRLDAAPASLLLPPDELSILELALDRAVVASSAAVVGSMEAVMTLCADYLKQRTQFGQPLSKFQALQHRMAEMFIETDQARSMLYPALAALESGDEQQRRRAVSGTKWMVSRAAHFVAGQGIQLHGGIGITEEFAAAHHYKSMLTYDKRFGDTSFHLRRSTGLTPGPR